MANILLTLDAIRNSGTGDYQTRIPSAVDTSLQTVGKALESYTPGANEFLNTLINKIGLTLVSSKMAKNKLSIFKREQLQMGDTVEEIFISIAKGVEYDPVKAETEVFKRVKPEVDVLFHKINAQMMWKVTVQHNELIRAFQSESAFTRFVSGIVQSIYNGRVLDEYINMKQLFTEAVADGKANILNTPMPVDEETSKGFVKAVKRVAKGMTYIDTQYNFLGKETFTEQSDMVLVLHKDVSIEVSTELLASAFNKGEFDYDTQVVEVDSLGNDPTIIGALIDREWLMVLDVLQRTDSIYNPQGLYFNHFVHHHAIYSYSTFKNAVFFKTTA